MLLKFYTAQRYFVSHLAYLHLKCATGTFQTESLNQKRKTSYIKRNSKYFNGNFSATGCWKNCLKTQLFLTKVTTGACRPRTPCILKTVILRRQPKNLLFFRSFGFHPQDDTLFFNLGLLLYAFRPFVLFCFHKISAHFFGVSSSFGLCPHSTQNPLHNKYYKYIKPNRIMKHTQE